MKNKDIYATPIEQSEAFRSYCQKHPNCTGCQYNKKGEACWAHWLNGEADIIECPFCGGRIMIVRNQNLKAVEGYCLHCAFRSPFYDNEKQLISAIDEINNALDEKRKAKK